MPVACPPLREKYRLGVRVIRELCVHAYSFKILRWLRHFTSGRHLSIDADSRQENSFSRSSSLLYNESRTREPDRGELFGENCERYEDTKKISRFFF